MAPSAAPKAIVKIVWPQFIRFNILNVFLIKYDTKNQEHVVLFRHTIMQPKLCPFINFSLNNKIHSRIVEQWCHWLKDLVVEGSNFCSTIVRWYNRRKIDGLVYKYLIAIMNYKLSHYGNSPDIVFKFLPDKGQIKP